MNNKNLWYNKEIIDLDIIKIVLIIMVGVYPLIVVPNELGYFYFPRYIMLYILSILCIPSLVKAKRNKFLGVYVPLIIYILCLFISGFTSIEKETAWMGLFGEKLIYIANKKTCINIMTSRFTGISTIIFCIILYFVSYKYNDNMKVVKYMVACASIVGFIAVLQHFNINIVPHEYFREGTPPYGTIGQHDFLATYEVFILPASIYNYLKGRNKLWLLCSCLIYAGLLVSTTRGSWIACFISMVVMGLYYFKRKEYKKNFTIVVMSLLIVTVSLMATKNGTLIKRASTITSNISSALQLEDQAGSGRLMIWKNIIKFLPQYWTFGVGPDNLIYLGLCNGQVDKAHNIYLETAITMGIPALIAYLWFLSFFLRPWKTDKGFMFFSMISTYLIQGFFNIDVIMVLPLFWIVLGFSQKNIEYEKILAKV